MEYTCIVAGDAVAEPAALVLTLLKRTIPDAELSELLKCPSPFGDASDIPLTVNPPNLVCTASKPGSTGYTFSCPHPTLAGITVSLRFLCVTKPDDLGPVLSNLTSAAALSIVLCYAPCALEKDVILSRLKKDWEVPLQSALASFVANRGSLSPPVLVVGTRMDLLLDQFRKFTSTSPSSANTAGLDLMPSASDVSSVCDALHAKGYVEIGFAQPSRKDARNVSNRSGVFTSSFSATSSVSGYTTMQRTKLLQRILEACAGELTNDERDQVTEAIIHEQQRRSVTVYIQTAQAELNPQSTREFSESDGNLMSGSFKPLPLSVAGSAASPNAASPDAGSPLAGSPSNTLPASPTSGTAAPAQNAQATWTWRRNPKNGRVFYINRFTRKAQYHRPDDYDGEEPEWKLEEKLQMERQKQEELEKQLALEKQHNDLVAAQLDLQEHESRMKVREATANKLNADVLRLKGAKELLEKRRLANEGMRKQIQGLQEEVRNRESLFLQEELEKNAELEKEKNAAMDKMRELQDEATSTLKDSELASYQSETNSLLEQCYRLTADIRATLESGASIHEAESGTHAEYALLEKSVQSLINRCADLEVEEVDTSIEINLLRKELERFEETRVRPRVEEIESLRARRLAKVEERRQREQHIDFLLCESHRLDLLMDVATRATPEFLSKRDEAARKPTWLAAYHSVVSSKHPENRLAVTERATPLPPIDEEEFDRLKLLQQKAQRDYVATLVKWATALTRASTAQTRVDRCSEKLMELSHHFKTLFEAYEADCRTQRMRSMQRWYILDGNARRTRESEAELNALSDRMSLLDAEMKRTREYREYFARRLGKDREVASSLSTSFSTLESNLDGGILQRALQQRERMWEHRRLAAAMGGAEEKRVDGALQSTNLPGKERVWAGANSNLQTLLRLLVSSGAEGTSGSLKQQQEQQQNQHQPSGKQELANSLDALILLLSVRLSEEVLTPLFHNNPARSLELAHQSATASIQSMEPRDLKRAAHVFRQLLILHQNATSLVCREAGRRGSKEMILSLDTPFTGNDTHSSCVEHVVVHSMDDSPAASLYENLLQAFCKALYVESAMDATLTESATFIKQAHGRIEKNRGKYDTVLKALQGKYTMNR